MTKSFTLLPHAEYRRTALGFGLQKIDIFCLIFLLEKCTATNLEL